MKKVVYKDGDFEVTTRELIISLAILFIMISLGIIINECILSDVDNKIQEYDQAIKIENSKDLFEYGMLTNIGNAFVYGTLKAIDPVSLPEIDGEYAYIRKVEEHYTRHTKIVIDYDSDGKVCGDHIEIYYTWDEVGSDIFHCNRISFVDHEFDYGKIPFPLALHSKTITASSTVRFQYYVIRSEYDGTLYCKLSDGTISNVKFIAGKTLQAAVDSMQNIQKSYSVIFWILWFIITFVVLIAFCKFDNNWLEN